MTINQEIHEFAQTLVSPETNIVGQQWQRRTRVQARCARMGSTGRSYVNGEKISVSARHRAEAGGQFSPSRLKGLGDLFTIYAHHLDSFPCGHSMMGLKAIHPVPVRGAS